MVWAHDPSPNPMIPNAFVRFLMLSLMNFMKNPMVWTHSPAQISWKFYNDFKGFHLLMICPLLGGSAKKSAFSNSAYLVDLLGRVINPGLALVFSRMIQGMIRTCRTSQLYQKKSTLYSCYIAYQKNGELLLVLYWTKTFGSHLLQFLGPCLITEHKRHNLCRAVHTSTQYIPRWSQNVSNGVHVHNPKKMQRKHGYPVWQLDNLKNWSMICVTTAVSIAIPSLRLDVVEQPGQSQRPFWSCNDNSWGAKR